MVADLPMTSPRLQRHHLWFVSLVGWAFANACISANSKDEVVESDSEVDTRSNTDDNQSGDSDPQGTQGCYGPSTPQFAGEIMFAYTFTAPDVYAMSRRSLVVSARQWIFRYRQGDEEYRVTYDIVDPQRGTPAQGPRLPKRLGTCTHVDRASRSGTDAEAVCPPDDGS